MNGVNEDKIEAGLRNTVLHVVAGAVMLLVVLGALIRLTVRDTYLVTAILYYPTSPASMTLMMLLAVLCLPRSKLRTRRLAAVFFVLAIAWTGFTQWETNAQPPAEANGKVHTLMFWNVYRGHWGWDGVVSKIQSQNPDVVALAEFLLPEGSEAQFFAEHFPGYEFVTFSRDLAVLTRIPIVSTRRLAWTDSGIFESVTFDDSGQQFTLVLADVSSDLLQHRKEPMGQLIDAVEQFDGPVLIAGDFNTPIDSVFLDPLRTRFRSAFEEAGTGLHSTWPMPLPVLAIDHVWGSEDVTFHSAEILGTMNSDHRAIFVEFTFGP